MQIMVENTETAEKENKVNVYLNKKYYNDGLSNKGFLVQLIGFPMLLDILNTYKSAATGQFV